MPKKSGKNTKKAAPKGGAGSSKRKGGGVQRHAAPAATSSYVKQYVNFYGGGENLGIRGKLALFDVKTTGVAGDTSGLISPVSAVGVACCRMSPTLPVATVNGGTYTNTGFVSPAMDLLCSAFTRYKQKKAIFHYLPLFTTNSTQQIIFGFAADPCHPILSGSTAAVPTFSSIESLSDSRPFAPWDEWKMDVSSKLCKEWLYLSTNGGDTTAGSDTARFDNWGSIGCVLATASAATAERYGVLYLEFDLELKEFCPISVTRPALLRALQEKLSFHLEKHQARTAQGESPEDSQRSTGIDVSSLSLLSSGETSSSSKPLYKELELEDFISLYRTRRDEGGMSANEAVKSISGEYVLSDRCMRLVVESGLAYSLSSPAAGSKPVEEEKEEACLSPSLGVVTFAEVKKSSVSNPKEGLK